MSDFTKKELEELFFNLSEIRSWCDDAVRKWPLLDKIEFMLENYCSHDGEIGKDYPAEKCMKCGAYWE